MKIKINSMTNKEDNAFPVRTDVSFRAGLTKREYLSALMMQALVSDPAYFMETDDSDIAFSAVSSADALIHELNMADSLEKPK